MPDPLTETLLRIPGELIARAKELTPKVVAVAYSEGMGLVEIARLLGTSYGHVHNMLADAGIERRPRGRPTGVPNAPHEPKARAAYLAARAERVKQMVALRAEHQTLEQIGQQFGMSRERVRQVLKTKGITGCRPKPQKWPIPLFQHRMRGWLKEAGWGYCAFCKTWLCPSELTGSAQSICRPCNAKRARQSRLLYPKIRETQKRWKQTHPENIRAAYEALVSTPEGREKVRAAGRKQYARLAATPEGREKLASHARARYARRKAKAKGPDA